MPAKATSKSKSKDKPTTKSLSMSKSSQRENAKEYKSAKATEVSKCQKTAESSDEGSDDEQSEGEGGADNKNVDECMHLTFFYCQSYSLLTVLLVTPYWSKSGRHVYMIDPKTKKLVCWSAVEKPKSNDSRKLEDKMELNGGSDNKQLFLNIRVSNCHRVPYRADLYFQGYVRSLMHAHVDNPELTWVNFPSESRTQISLLVCRFYCYICVFY
jgi:hypothetical protein